MNTFWLILLVAVTLLPTLLAGAKKARASRAAAYDEVADGAEESNDDSFFNFDTEEQREVEQPSYFTYEAPEPEVRRAPKPAQAPVRTVVEEPQPRPAFDLRQAVIYQTVLDNRYINAEN